MSEKYSKDSTFNRLLRSRRARAAVLVAGLALTGCSAAKTTGATSSGRSTAVAVGARTPGSPSASATPGTVVGTAPPIRTSPASRANWCTTTVPIIEEAFANPVTAQDCEVMPTSATPGDVLIKYTINVDGVQNLDVQFSVFNSPFKFFTGKIKPTSGYGTEYVQVPNSTMMYVEDPGNQNVTGEVNVLSGDGGEFPVGLQNMIPMTAGAFAVFGTQTIKQLYPAGAP